MTKSCKQYKVFKFTAKLSIFQNICDFVKYDFMTKPHDCRVNFLTKSFQTFRILFFF